MEDHKLFQVIFHLLSKFPIEKLLFLMYESIKGGDFPSQSPRNYVK